MTEWRARNLFVFGRRKSVQAVVSLMNETKKTASSKDLGEKEGMEKKNRKKRGRKKRNLTRVPFLRS